MFRRNLAHLQIGARGHMGERTAELVTEIGKTRKLPVLHDAVRDPKPAHIGVLRWPDIEDTVIAPAEIVGRRWPCIDRGLIAQPRIGVERMFLALPFLLLDQLL